jgi:pterin-4a-carbinolamine dehydratase
MAHKILSDAEIETSLKSAKGWKTNGKNIEKTFTFETFRDAIAYIVLVGIEAEMLNHSIIPTISSPSRSARMTSATRSPTWTSSSPNSSTPSRRDFPT